jgi:hypothetical protein
MPDRVVDRLEPVEVDEQDGQRVRGGRPRLHVLELADHESSIG